jgi:two-component system chemotaxis sensor kinase CheA
VAEIETHEEYLEEVWSLFAAEGKETLDLVEEALLELESDPTNAGQVARLFRGLHTFKGEARMMGLSTIESLAHRAEDLVALVRDEGVTLTGAMIDLLLRVLDHSRGLLNYATARRHDAEVDQVEELVVQLEVMLAEHTDGASSLPKPPPDSTDVGMDGPADASSAPEVIERAEEIDEPFLAVELIDLATDPGYVRIFLELAGEKLGSLCGVLDTLSTSDERGRDDCTREIKAAVDALTHAAGQMGYERLVAVLNEIVAAVEGLGGEAQATRLDELKRVLAEEMAIIQEEARSLGVEVDIQPLLWKLRADSAVERSSLSGSQEAITESRSAVPTEPLISLMEDVGALVAARATLHRVTQRLTEVNLLETVTRLAKQSGGDWWYTLRELQTFLAPWADDLNTLAQIEAEMGAVLDHFQETALALRARPAAEILEPLLHLVQDVAQRQGKLVTLDLDGTDIDLDYSALDVLADPVRRLAWFAVAHSIEEPAQRQEAGKPATGHISIVARRTANRVQVVIEDDGRGIDRKAVLKRARKLGWTKRRSVLPPDKLSEWVVRDGFGALDVSGLDVDDLSGEEVNLASISAKLQTRQGWLTVASEPGQGARFSLELPLDMVVMDSMVMRVRDVQYVVPIGAVHRIVKPEETQIVQSSADGTQYLLRLEGELVSIQTLTGDVDKDDLREGLLLVVEAGDGRLALAVDELIGQQQVLLQPLQGQLMDVQGISGCALLGEGNVGMVLNLHRMNA